MDLSQVKLTKYEWGSIEILCSAKEQEVLQMIIAGYHDASIHSNGHKSLVGIMRLENYEHQAKLDACLYSKYLKAKILGLSQELNISFVPASAGAGAAATSAREKEFVMNSALKIILDKYPELDFDDTNSEIYEIVLLQIIKKFAKSVSVAGPMAVAAGEWNKDMCVAYYTLHALSKNNIRRLNTYVSQFVHYVLQEFMGVEADMQARVSALFITHAADCIEKNPLLLKYVDLSLYNHQKEIFTVAKQPGPKLILYIAPTATGKTMTPLGLSEGHKIIFVCAARHVGMALAKAAISVEKRIAFAFGCSTATDIRLHNFAAVNYTRDKRSGGIRKVDNEDGSKVEIMICDMKSYLTAMHYMLAFFGKETIITYWDEPTISMDYDEHEFHPLIHQNWSENLIPTIVLSSATLPKEHELTNTIQDFVTRFSTDTAPACVCNIVSHECKKTIPLINNSGQIELPHYASNVYSTIRGIAANCLENLTLLRYFDLEEVVAFILYVQRHNLTTSRMAMDMHFDGIDAVNMKNIKLYYVNVLANIVDGERNWASIYDYFCERRTPKIRENMYVDVRGNPRPKQPKSFSAGPGVGCPTPSFGAASAGKPLSKMASTSAATMAPGLPPAPAGTCGIYVTTIDSHTLTDGPTIFMTADVEKVATFCVQQANIPSATMDDILRKIEYNNSINARLFELENQLEAERESVESKVKNTIDGRHGGKTIACGRNKRNKDPKKMCKDGGDDSARGTIAKLSREIISHRSMIATATLGDVYIPNRKHHLEKWAPPAILHGMSTGEKHVPFTSDVSEDVVNDIMALNGIATIWKILLMMGIGAFTSGTANNVTYAEIMKKLADEQKLYLIIASSDHIYGTNYQFCHGFISKDMNLTFEKLLQSMGRIGRGNIQQTYTIRFRDNSQIMKLFTGECDKPEVRNMNRLFSTPPADMV